MKNKRVFLFIIIFNFFHLNVGKASSDDIGFNECRSELIKSGKIIPNNDWRVYPTPKVNPEIDDQDPSLEMWTARRLSFLNKNHTRTIIEEEKNPHEDADMWNVTLVDHEAVRSNISVSAAGVGISKKTNDGVNGLYFCGPQGISNEWIWDGTSWKLSFP